MESDLKNFMDEIEFSTLEFLERLKKTDGNRFSPALEGLTNVGNELSLGFSCYALKIIFMLNNDSFNDKDFVDQWSAFINSHQNKYGEFIDNKYLNYMNKNSIEKNTKDILKTVLNIFGKDYLTNKDILKNSLRAESKQCIASLYQIGSKNKIVYSQFPKQKYEIKNFLDNLNWSKPWSAGGQFAALSVFLKTQLVETNTDIMSDLQKFVKKINDKETGTYFIGKVSSNDELINGSMKIITGLDWLNFEILYPEKLIDFCLNNQPSHEGCNVVDTVYVLWMCSKQTNYKRKEIQNYLYEVIEIIKLHHFQSGGFSYYLNKSQIYYYGLKITTGRNTPDIHGTILFIWALSMINDLCEIGMEWKTLKP